MVGVPTGEPRGSVAGDDDRQQPGAALLDHRARAEADRRRIWVTAAPTLG